MVAVLVEYIRSLNQFEIEVEVRSYYFVLEYKVVEEKFSQIEDK